MNLNIVKTVSGLVVSAGVSAIVGNALKQATPENAGRVKKISMAVGAFALSGMMAAKASDYVDEQIDQVGESISSITNIVKKVKKGEPLDVAVDEELPEKEEDDK